MLTDILHKFWAYKTFRPQQREIIESLIAGKDTLAVLPTGGGKSICYQIPAIAAQGTALVISPLIALMKDQVTRLQDIGIPAALLSASNTQSDHNNIIQAALAGRYKLLYIAPERLLSEQFLETLRSIPISFLAVDEAHCISQWGHDFRPAYRKIPVLFEYIGRLPVIALTASAADDVKKDIQQQLQMRHPVLFTQSVVRHNLSYKVDFPESKLKAVVELLKHQSGSAIVYCNSRRKTEEIALLLQRHQLDAKAYHAGMHKALRTKTQDEWTRKNNQVICATTAFGMGIDKPDVRTVIHMDVPENIASYYQEAGRAGRDGNPSACILLANDYDFEQLQTRAHSKFPATTFITAVYEKIMKYLGIAFGEGAETLFAFDIVQFIQQFELPVYETIAAVKTIQKDGYWQWNETDTIGSKLMFTTDEYSVRALEKINPRLHKVAVAILRLYGSVFTFPTFIDEFLIAKTLEINKLKLDQYLHQLGVMGFINYQAYEGNGTLFMLRDRIPLQYFKLNTTLHEQLKNKHFEKIRQITDYCFNTSDCRNIQLARYFDEDTQEPCGTCDNCIKRNIPALSKKELLLQLQQMKHEYQTVSIKQLQNKFVSISEGKIIEYLRFLNDEGSISLDMQAGVVHIK